jgi:dTDP-4-dehydrorhamnose 3,5-epimerase
MPFQEMKIPGAWIHTPDIFSDNRGVFHEVFKKSYLEDQIGRSFQVQQVNQSISIKGVLRGIHYTVSNEGQAKFVSCPTGALWDVVVDLRPFSSTYGHWDAVEISQDNKKSVFISEGLGHAFLSLEDGTVANYLCSSEYLSEADRTISPFSPGLGIAFEEMAKLHKIKDFVLSQKDSGAPFF